MPRLLHAPFVREYTTADLAAVAYVWHAAEIMSDGQPLEPSNLGDLPPRIMAGLNAGWRIYVAVLDASVVGAIAISLEKQALEKLFVAPLHQRKGIGTELLEVAKRIMPDGFSLKIASADFHARHFFERHGCLEVGTLLPPCLGGSVAVYAWKQTQVRVTGCN